jgi:hypothetical protein
VSDGNPSKRVQQPVARAGLLPMLAHVPIVAAVQIRRGRDTNCSGGDPTHRLPSKVSEHHVRIGHSLPHLESLQDRTAVAKVDAATVLKSPLIQHRAQSCQRDHPPPPAPDGDKWCPPNDHHRPYQWHWLTPSARNVCTCPVQLRGR